MGAQPEQIAEAQARNAGKRIVPTIAFYDGTFMVEPSNEELAERIGLSRTVPNEGPSSLPTLFE